MAAVVAGREGNLRQCHDAGGQKGRLVRAERRGATQLGPGSGVVARGLFASGITNGAEARAGESIDAPGRTGGPWHALARAT